MKRNKMPLPLIRRCGCVSLEKGCLTLCIISTLACFANITVGALELRPHLNRTLEEKFISMSMVMFSSLSAIGNIVALSGILLKRAGNLQLSIVFNSVFILCIMLVAVVKCIFTLPVADPRFQQPEYILLLVVLLVAGAAYSIFYLMVVNSLYRVMKMSYGDSAIPI